MQDWTLPDENTAVWNYIEMSVMIDRLNLTFDHQCPERWWTVLLISMLQEKMCTITLAASPERAAHAHAPKWFRINLLIKGRDMETHFTETHRDRQ